MARGRPRRACTLLYLIDKVAAIATEFSGEFVKNLKLTLFTAALAGLILSAINTAQIRAQSSVYAENLLGRNQAVKEILEAVYGDPYAIVDPALKREAVTMAAAVAPQCEKHGKVALNQWFRLTETDDSWEQNAIAAKMFWDGLCVDKDRAFAQQIYDKFGFLHGPHFHRLLESWIDMSMADFFRVKDNGFEVLEDKIIDGVEYSIIFSGGRPINAGVHIALAQKLGLPGRSAQEKEARAAPSIGTPFLNTELHEQSWPISVADAYTIADILSDLQANTLLFRTEGLERVLESLAMVFRAEASAQMAFGVTAHARFHPIENTSSVMALGRQKATLKKRAWLALALPHLRGTDPVDILKRYGKQAHFKAPNLLVLASYVAALAVDEQEYAFQENYKENIQAINRGIYAGVLSGFANGSDKKLARTYIEIAYCRLNAETKRNNLPEGKKVHLQSAMYELLLFRNELVGGLVNARQRVFDAHKAKLEQFFAPAATAKLIKKVHNRAFSLVPDDMGTSTDLNAACPGG